MKTRRRNVLLGASAVVAAGSLPAPAIAQGIKELKMVTSWPKGTSDDSSAERLAASITTMSDGRLKVTVYPADRLVRRVGEYPGVAVDREAGPETRSDAGQDIINYFFICLNTRLAVSVQVDE